MRQYQAEALSLLRDIKITLDDISEQLEDLSKVNRNIYNKLSYPVIIMQDNPSPSLSEILKTIRKEK